MSAKPGAPQLAALADVHQPQSFYLEQVCPANAPAKLRCANTNSKPPWASRAPSASAGCYAVREIHGFYCALTKTSTCSRTMRREQQFRRSEERRVGKECRSRWLT